MAFRSRDLGVKLAAGSDPCLNNTECARGAASGCGGTQLCPSPTKCDHKSCRHSSACPEHSGCPNQSVCPEITGFDSGCGGTQTRCCPVQGLDSPDATYKAGSYLAGLELLRAQLRASLSSAAH